MVKNSYINRIHRNAASLKKKEKKQPTSESTPPRKSGLSIRSNPIFRLFSGGKKKGDRVEASVTRKPRIRLKIEECTESPDEQEERDDRIETVLQNEERDNVTKDTHPSNEGEARGITTHGMHHSSIDMTGAVASPNYKKSAFKRPTDQRRKKKKLGFQNSQQQWVYFPNKNSGSYDQSDDEVSILASETGETSVGAKSERGATAAKKKVTCNEDTESTWAGLYTSWNVMGSTGSGGSVSTVTYQWHGFGIEDSVSGESSSNSGSGSGSGSGSFDSYDDNTSSGTPTVDVVNIHLPQQSLMSRILQSQDDQIQLQAREIKRLKRKEKESQLRQLQIKQEAKQLLDEYEAKVAKMAELEREKHLSRRTFRKVGPRIGSSSRSVASRPSVKSKSSVFKLKSLFPGRHE